MKLLIKLVFIIICSQLVSFIYSKELKVDLGEIKIPYINLGVEIELTGELEFEKGWLKREFPKEYETGIRIEIEFGGSRIAQGTLKGITNILAKWQAVIKANHSIKLLSKQLKEIKSGKFKVIMKYQGLDRVIWGG